MDLDRIHVACSEWQYKHWKGDFYPAELPTTRWFAHYAGIFDTVEINRYDDARLDEWAEWLAERARTGRPVFAYFNNDTGGHAPRDAVRLRSMILSRL
jgi:uncharacterized protein YecE (DUF72 family)